MNSNESPSNSATSSEQSSPQVLTGLVFSLPKNAGLESWIAHESATEAAMSLRQSYSNLSDLEWRLHFLARDLESAFPERFRGEVL